MVTKKKNLTIIQYKLKLPNQFKKGRKIKCEAPPSLQFGLASCLSIICFFQRLPPLLENEKNHWKMKACWIKEVCYCCCSKICHDLLLILVVSVLWFTFPPFVGFGFQTKLANHKCLIHIWFVCKPFTNDRGSSNFGIDSSSYSSNISWTLSIVVVFEDTCEMPKLCHIWKQVTTQLQYIINVTNSIFYKLYILILIHREELSQCLMDDTKWLSPIK